MDKKQFTAAQARAILAKAGQPARDTVKAQLDLITKKIKIASTLKMNKLRYEVIAHYNSPCFDGDLALTVARKLKARGFTVKIRKRELAISW
jgi:hypothetical protein